MSERESARAKHRTTMAATWVRSKLEQQHTGKHGRLANSGLGEWNATPGDSARVGTRRQTAAMYDVPRGRASGTRTGQNRARRLHGEPRNRLRAGGRGPHAQSEQQDDGAQERDKQGSGASSARQRTRLSSCNREQGAVREMEIGGRAPWEFGEGASRGDREDARGSHSAERASGTRRRSWTELCSGSGEIRAGGQGRGWGGSEQKLAKRAEGAEGHREGARADRGELGQSRSGAPWEGDPSRGAEGGAGHGGGKGAGRAHDCRGSRPAGRNRGRRGWGEVGREQGDGRRGSCRGEGGKKTDWAAGSYPRPERRLEISKHLSGGREKSGEEKMSSRQEVSRLER
jgi:hypothetical protein